MTLTAEVIPERDLWSLRACLDLLANPVCFDRVPLLFVCATPLLSLSTTSTLLIFPQIHRRKADMLDSSTAALPLIRKTLKRSASTASLPTPPRTHRKHARGRSRGSCDSDSDDFGLLSDKEELTGQNKKRRTEETGIVEADEEAFWLSRPSEAASSTKIDSCLISKSQSAPLLYRKRESQNSRINVAPVSPPPSHRKSTTIVASAKNSSMSVNASPVTSPPSTPRTRSSTKRVTCDLAENPFLATPVGNSDTPELTASSADPSPRTPSYDKPYITYVLYVHILQFVIFTSHICVVAVARVEPTRTHIIIMQRAGPFHHLPLLSFLSNIQTIHLLCSALRSCSFLRHTGNLQKISTPHQRLGVKLEGFPCLQVMKKMKSLLRFDPRS